MSARSGAGLAPLALTMGEPAGVGGELTLKAWLARDPGSHPFFAIDDPDRLSALAKRLGWTVAIQAIDDPAQAAAIFPQALPVLPEPLAVTPIPGAPDVANAPAVIRSIERAVTLAMAGRAAGVVTNPIHKHALKQAGFAFPGHTEFLADLSPGKPMPVMMLACPALRVVPVTIHVSILEAVAQLSTDLIVQTATITAKALARDFGLAQPRLALAGLNPHAGEGGVMGREDAAVVAPAVERLQAAGIQASGPLPADTLFHAEARQTYDVAICMYHDQALIPIKTIDFHGGVNVTLGLPFVRTSPDHGTAFGLAGTGQANPGSLIAALTMAGDMAKARAA